MTATANILNACRDILQDIDTPNIIIAFSGGPDSTVLLHGLHRVSRDMETHGHPTPHIIAAHCNFHLRDEESDRDAEFVTKECGEKGINLLKIDFDTATYCRENGVSIEMGARQLRHEWFERLCQEHKALLATGHNSDDNIETMLLNMLRGSGVRGVKGMLPRQRHIVRPLLGITRREIMRYIEENGVSYVLDSTNESTDYRRNYLRHEIIPRLESQWGGARRALATTLRCLAEDNAVIEQAIHRALPSSGELLRWDTLRDFAAPRLLIYRHFDEYGITPAIAREITSHIVSPRIGAKWHLRDRTGKEWIVEATMHGLQAYNVRVDKETPQEEYTWESVVLAGMEEVGRVKNLPLNECALPFGKERYIWREVSKRMRFKPLGMKGSKEISDILRDAHLNPIEKQRIKVLCRREDGEGVWIPGIKRARVDLISKDDTEIWIVKRKNH